MMHSLSITANPSTQLVYDHFQERVNREGHLIGTVDGNLVFFTSDYATIPESLRPSLRPFHINFFTFSKFFEALDGKTHLVFVETGTSANAVDSTTLLDKWVRTFGGSLTTIDIDPTRKLAGQHRWGTRTEAVVSDSVRYLKDWAVHHPHPSVSSNSLEQGQDASPTSPFRGHSIDAVYLDSWDVDWFNPDDCQTHGLAEFEAILPHLSPRAWILIDDTPQSPEWIPNREDIFYYVSGQVHHHRQRVPGKGALVLERIQHDPRFRVIAHQYQLLIEYVADRTI